MNITTFYPQQDILKKHILYYYFLKADSPDFNSTYYAFPNTNIPLSIHRSATCSIKEHSTAVQASQKGPCIALVQRSYLAPLLVNLKGPVDKVTICFKPAGISPFISQAFGVIAPQDSQVFTAWDALPGYANFLQTFFATNDHAEKVLLLEDFLLRMYHPMAEQALLEQAIVWLADFSEDRSMDTIAAGLGLTTRTFNRLFDKHMSISPVAWRKIARFRHSLDNKLFNDRFKKLTEIGYASNFYDQAYFIKVYNKLTGANPTAFFKSIEKLADDRLIFRFIKE